MDRSPKDDTKVLMRGKEIEPSDAHPWTEPKSPVATMGKRPTNFNGIPSLIPTETPGKGPNRNIRASSPIHEVYGDSEDSGRGNGRNDERVNIRSHGRDSVESSKASSVRVSTTSPYQGAVSGVRSVAEMRSSPLPPGMKHGGSRESPIYRHGQSFPNSPTSGHPMNQFQGYPQGYPQFQGYPPGWAPIVQQPVQAPVLITPEAIAKAKKEELRLYYAGLTEAEKTDALEIFKSKFTILKATHKDKKFEMYSPKMSLEAIHELYEMHLKTLGAESMAGQFEMLLRIIFLGIELVCVKWVGVDIRGFAAEQMRNIGEYNRALLMLGEDWTGPTGRGLPPLAQILIMVLLNAFVMGITRLVASTEQAKSIGMTDGGDVYNIVKPLANSYVHRMATPAPVDIDTITKTPNVPAARGPGIIDNVLTGGLNAFGIPTRGDFMETMTSWGADQIATMNMPQQKERKSKRRDSDSDSAAPRKSHGDTAKRSKKSRVVFNGGDD